MASKPAESAEKTESAPRASLSDKDSAKVAKAVAGLGFDEDTTKAATRYATKLVKKQQGLRNTPAPRTGLTAEQAKSVRQSLGIKDPEPKAEKTETADAS